MMLDTADNKIFFARFYDIDTICSYDNSGQLKFDVDIEMEQGYWNTSSSRLWTRIRDLMHNDIVTTYNNMRQNGVSYENMMKYIYDEQIAKIPQTYYNKDYDVKYAPFADSYIGMAHGDTYEHVKRWLKQRFTFVDTLFDYAPSYNNDVLTIRANTTELMTLEIETYTPVYQHVSWYNGQMDKKKIDGKVSVEFSGTAQAATDQEVLIYGGSNVKSIKGITSMNPNRMLIGSATKLVEIDAHDCPLLADINANKANLSPHEYLNKVNLSNCPLLEGNLRLNNSPLVQEINIKGTNITGMNLPSSIRNLQTLRLPNTMTELTLNDANMLHTLEFDEGVNLQSVSMTNCNALENINFDLLQTPSITLNNSYNNVAELYFRDTTNLSLSNMSNLERVIFTPNNEYETFEMINVANAPDYKITTFNCPKLSTFMTTAPYRESYNNCDIRDYHTYPLSYKVSNGYYKDGKFFPTSNETYYHYEVNISKNKNMTHHIKAISTTKQYQTIRCTYFNNSTWISTQLIDNSANVDEDIAIPNGCNKIIFVCDDIVMQEVRIPYKVKDYDDIQPNTTFTANSIDISNTQFTDVKLLCTTDTNTLKLPTTVKNFYCDSSFDLDTNYLEDGEYDVVHGELVEPYTTDYEGEVLCNVAATELFTLESGTYPWNDRTYHTDFIRVAPNTSYTSNMVATGFWCVTFLAEDKETVVYKYVSSNGTDITAGNGVTPNNAYYMVFSCLNNNNPLTLEYIKGYVPNIIPSSADGSLIFSMYAPNNTVAPASGTWDLKGLEFDNFHTFGMNNDVKGEYEVQNIPNFEGIIFTSDCYKGTRKPSTYAGYFQMGWLNLNNATVITSDGSKIGIYIPGSTFTYPSSKIIDEPCVALSFYPTVEWVKIIENGIEYHFEKSSLKLGTKNVSLDDTTAITLSVSSIVTGDLQSITMPSRYDDYNITIKNANISPKTHNTMLYPLLVNEDNPITGTLDYTNYAGKHLSWSFAYTDEEYVDIIQPKEELINSYEYRYNAFYQTDYEFDNPYEVARYTSSARGVLPTFNAEFTYTYDEIDNGDGTYTTKIYTDDLDNLPTRISFATKPVIRVDKLNTSQATNLNGLFQNCNKLVYVNTANWVTSNVTNMTNMFHSCSVLTSLDVSGFDTSNVTAMDGMFVSCNGLTSLDLSGFDTSKVTTMNGMFHSCNNLHTIILPNTVPTNPFSMERMFQSCNVLTDITWTDKVIKPTSLGYTFYECRVLTSLDLSKWDTSELTNTANMLEGCLSLTSLNTSNWNTGKVTNMANMFQKCSSLTSLDLSNFDTSEVTRMDGMFQNCSKLTSLNVSSFDTSKISVMVNMFYNCSSLTSLDLSGFNTSKVTNMSSMFFSCNKLTSLNVESWSSDNVNTIIPQLSVSPSTSTLYGTVIIDETKLPRGWVYDNALEIAKYTANATGVLPSFNTEFTGYTTGETNNGDGTYTVSIATDSLDNLPTIISFNGKTTLLTVDKLNTSRVTNMSFMFYKCSNVTYINSSNWNTSSITTMNNMFNGCNKLTSLDVSGFDTSNVTNMGNMFSNCNNLTSLDVSRFDTGKVINMSNMFNNCNNLTSLDLSKFDTGEVTNMDSMFMGCVKLTSLDVSGFDTSNVTNMTNMFNYCSGLIELDSMQNISVALDLSFTILDATSLLDVIDNLVSLKVVVDEVNCTLIESGGTDMETGEIKSGTSCVSDETFYKVYAGKTYEINTNGSWLYVACYYANNKAFKGSLYSGANNTNDSCIITPSTDGYIRVSAVKAPNANTTITIKECILNNPQTLTLGSTLLAKLTEDQIAIAVNKGWNIS